MRESEASRLLFLIRMLLPLLLLTLAVMLYQAYTDFRSTLLDRAGQQMRIDAVAGASQFAELLREYRESLKWLAVRSARLDATDTPPDMLAALLDHYRFIHAGTVVAIERRAADARLDAHAGLSLPPPAQDDTAAALLLQLAGRTVLVLTEPLTSAAGETARLRLALDLTTLASRALGALTKRDDVEGWLFDAEGRVLWQAHPAGAVPAAAASSPTADDFGVLRERLRRETAGSGLFRLQVWRDAQAHARDQLVGFAALPAEAGGLVLASAVEYRHIAAPLDQFALQLLLIGGVLTLTLAATAALLQRFRASAGRRQQRLDRLQALIGRVDQAMFDCEDPDRLHDSLARTLAEPVPGVQTALATRAADLADPLARERAQQVLSGGAARWDENRDGSVDALLPVSAPDGQPVAVLWFRQLGTPPPDAASRRLITRIAQDISHALVRMEDRSRRNAAETDLRLVASVFENIREAAVITDADNRILRVNPAFTTITGYQPSEVIGQTPALLASGRHGREFYTAMWRSLQDTGSWSGEICNRRKDGCEYLEWLSISVVRDAAGVIMHHVAVFADLSEHTAMRARIDWLASHDALTGLPNRASFIAALPGLLQRMAPGHCCAVLNLDLRRFQRLNETLGRSGGDRVLQALAERLNALAARPACLLARIAGDEFALAATGLPDEQAAGRFVAGLHTRLTEPLPVLPEPVSVSVDIGYALAPRDGRDGETLLRHAVAAARQARVSGEGWFGFDPQLGQRMQRRALLERSLRTAISGGELSLVYQPQIALADERVIGVEALMRWNHPRLGAVSPAEFIPIAEETGLIRTLGAWALDTACHEAAGWQRHCPRPPRVAVNLSARQFTDPGLITGITHALHSSGLPPAQLEIEITESLLMDNPARTVGVLMALRRTGVGVAIDDFGTGYSSLSYLKTFPLDRLKIDRAFVRDLPDNSDSAAIVQAIIALAHTLGLSVIAEGVEDEAQLEFLLGQDCDEVQGYLFAPPRAPAELHALLARGTTHPPSAGRRQAQSKGCGETVSNEPRA